VTAGGVAGRTTGFSASTGPARSALGEGRGGNWKLPGEDASCAMARPPETIAEASIASTAPAPAHRFMGRRPIPRFIAVSCPAMCPPCWLYLPCC
jgi:hypothetical protein